MKQRELTKIQLKVLHLEMEGKSKPEIAAITGFHLSTIYKKLDSIHKGIKKGRYSNVPINEREKANQQLF